MEEETPEEKQEREKQMEKAIEELEMTLIYDYYNSVSPQKRNRSQEASSSRTGSGSSSRSRSSGSGSMTKEAKKGKKTKVSPIAINPGKVEVPDVKHSPTETERQYKYKTRYLKENRNPISVAERMEYYPPLESEPYSKMPFQEELENILDEDYFKYTSLIMETVDKTHLGAFIYTEYLKVDEGITDFDTSVVDFEIILSYVDYLYIRIGEPGQYYPKQNQKKLEILTRLMEEECKDYFKNTYDVVIKNQSVKQKHEEETTEEKQEDETAALDLTLYEHGILKVTGESDEISNSELGRYSKFRITIDDKDNFDEDMIPTCNELRSFGLKKLFKFMSKSYYRLGNFIYYAINNYCGNANNMKLVNGKLYYPSDFTNNLLNSTERFYLVPLVMPQHMNILFFDTQLKTIERFEPNGAKIYQHFTKFIRNPENKQVLFHYGQDKILSEIEKSNYNYKQFFNNPDFQILLDTIQELINQNPSNFKPLQMGVYSLLIDMQLSNKTFAGEYGNFKLLLPFDYQNAVGPQSYYESDLELAIPTGLCVTFCYIYFMIRTKINTQQEFDDLQISINEMFFQFMLGWYRENIKANVTVDETNEKDKKTFTKQAIVEFIVKANDSMLNFIVARINDTFDVNLLQIGSRNIQL